MTCHRRSPFSPLRGDANARPALSNACHHHPYELAPTSGELTAWISDVATLISRIENAA